MAREKRIIFGDGGSLEAPDLPGNPQNRKRIFLLSPANMSGPRARLLLAPSAEFNLANRLRETGAGLGEIFSFISPLYFRGKLSYAEKFAAVFGGLPGIHIITPAGGLVPPNALVSLKQLQAITSGPVDENYPPYRQPLDRDAKKLFHSIDRDVEVALLGSIASPKYVEPLLQIFGRRLVFPKEFVGRGDMSRGGLLLRCVQATETLTFITVLGAAQHGTRPPRLPERRRI